MVFLVHAGRPDQVIASQRVGKLLKRESGGFEALRFDHHVVFGSPPSHEIYASYAWNLQKLKLQLVACDFPEVCDVARGAGHAYPDDRKCGKSQTVNRSG